jgi:hypothetical protein
MVVESLTQICEWIVSVRASVAMPRSALDGAATMRKIRANKGGGGDRQACV